METIHLQHLADLFKRVIELDKDIMKIKELACDLANGHYEVELSIRTKDLDKKEPVPGVDPAEEPADYLSNR